MYDLRYTVHAHTGLYNNVRAKNEGKFTCKKQNKNKLHGYKFPAIPKTRKKTKTCNDIKI